MFPSYYPVNLSVRKAFFPARKLQAVLYTSNFSFFQWNMKAVGFFGAMSSGTSFTDNADKADRIVGPWPP